MASIIELQIFIYLLPKGNFKVPILANIDDVINLYLWIQEANFDVENKLTRMSMVLIRVYM